MSTASAAGLLTQLSALGYSITKHAAVALAEWLAITYADAGIKVSCVCPQAVNTPMLAGRAEEDPVGSAPMMADSGARARRRRRGAVLRASLTSAS